MNFDAVKSAIKRIIPEYSSSFIIEEITSETGLDTFEIDSTDGYIVLRGNTETSIGLALNYYIRNYLEGIISWCGSRWNNVKKLPTPTKMKKVIVQKYRSYMNYCTYNYTASFWDFDRFEKELDFMFLNGINLPLCAVGIEVTWYKTLIRLGLSDEEARSCISGPAFLAWQWMGNIDGFMGPIPSVWLKKRETLAKKIIKRMREFSMQPIQQGFSGALPKKLMEFYPDAKIQKKGVWCGVDTTAQLDPTDPLFKKIGVIMLEEQKKLFGSYGFYASDPFHEGTPPTEDKDYLNKVGLTIYKMFKEFDKNAVWVAQSWSIRKDVVSVVPKEDLLILDLNGSGVGGHDAFWGYDFVTGNLHNFGGRINLHGDLRLLAENQYSKIKQEHKNVVGTGLFMEGIEQNPIYYDLAFEMLTEESPKDINKWLENYSLRRYGTDDENAKNAVKILSETAYKEGTNDVEKSSIIAARPALNIKKSGPNGPLMIPYENKEFCKCVKALRDCGGSGDGYLFDRIDTCRQLLTNYGQKLYPQIISSFKNKDEKAFKENKNRFLDLLDDVDNILSYIPIFTLDRWVESARKFGETENEKSYMEENAKNLLTLWGSPETGSTIFDYSWREWHGLISTFYKKRYEMFFDMLENCLKTGAVYSEEGLPLAHGREAFRANEFYEKLADFEVLWTKTPYKSYSTKKENPLSIVDGLIEKYDTLV